VPRNAPHRPRISRAYGPIPILLALSRRHRVLRRFGTGLADPTASPTFSNWWAIILLRFCSPGPYVFWDFLLQIFQRPDHILMIYRQGPELRHVRMNQAHPAQVTPSWYGDSVGHYEGVVLVIDTVGLRAGRSPWSTCMAPRTARRST
jgi:hypothetical protein